MAGAEQSAPVVLQPVEPPQDCGNVRLLLAGCWQSPPAAFSRRSEAQRTAKSTLRLFACCGLAGRPFWTACGAFRCRLWS